jgi:uncharacterized protein
MFRFQVLDSAIRTSSEAALKPFVDQWAALLTTYRRNGRPVATPVNVVVDGDRVMFRTYEQTGKFKRLRNDSRVTLQPCDARGRATSEQLVLGVARLLAGPRDADVSHQIDAKYPLFQGTLVRLIHRLARYRTVHFEVVPTEVAQSRD